MSQRYRKRKFGGYVNLQGEGFGVKGGLQAGGMYDYASGYGAYSIRSNALFGGSSVPFIRNYSITENAIIISHKEYLGDIITSATPGDFKIQSFDINPALSTTFEWLSQIAMNFEQYVMEGCLFCFKSFSADALNSTNTALGNVIMATNYNPYNPPFTNKAEMESYQFSDSFKPSEHKIHPVECAPAQTPVVNLYLRRGAVPSGADQRLYDLGVFSIATTGFQGASVNIGELWVTYQVALLKPKLFQALGLGDDAFSGYTTINNGVTNTAPFGATGPTNIPYNNSDITINSNTITFPVYAFPTTYFVMCRWATTIHIA